MSSAFVVLSFLGVMALFALALRWLQQRNRLPGSGGPGHAVTVLSSVTLGPQQRVLTLEVGPEGGRTALVVGVTAQSMHTLHQWPVKGAVEGRHADAFATSLRSSLGQMPGSPVWTGDVRRTDASDLADALKPRHD
ncbi:flagellar biosynthetic protein FliO [Comamonadaceae bacterium PP-2]